MLRTFVIAVLGFIVGAVLTYLVVVIGTTIVWDVFDVHDQDGGGAMALGLVIGPFVALLGGIASAFLLPGWVARRRRQSPASTDENQAHDKQLLLIIGGAIAGGIAGHYLAQIGFWFVGAIRIDSYWKIWAISWIPTLVTLLGAVAGGFLVRRMMRPQ